jgi:2-succinyl-6-hydroxy-2,4-cyclohexadiene-1-carboxylate synthase
MCWGPFADELAKQFEVILVDAPGHGESGHDEVDHWEAGRLLLEVGGRATYIGYSMGGRIAMHAALQSPDLVQGLVLIGAHPGIKSESDRSDRRRSDVALAAQLEVDGLTKFVDHWLENPMFYQLGPTNDFRAERLLNRPEGLVGSIVHVGTGSQRPLWDQLQRLRMPTFLIAGEIDDKFVKIGLQTLDAIGPTATLSIEAGLGHSVHLERPVKVAAAITSFIDEEVLDPEPQ